MAVQVINQIQTRPINKSTPYALTSYIGLSTDTKPIDCSQGSTFEETDSDSLWLFDGTDWSLKETFNKSFDRNGTQITIDYLHNKVHQGEMMIVSYIARNVASNATFYIHHKSGTTKYLHSEVTANTTGKWLFTSYNGATYTANGTVIPIIKRKSDSMVTPTAQFWHTPTITSNGTVRLQQLFGSGDTPSRVTSGEASERLESIFAPNLDILIGFTNETNASQDISIVFNFYEAT